MDVVEEDETRRRVRQWARRAAASLGIDVGQFVGCEESEISELARVQHREVFPAALDEWLLICGDDQHIGTVLNPEMIDSDVLRGIVERSDQALAIAGLAEAPWRDGVLFGGSTNGTILWMDDDTADPRVHYLVEDGELGSFPSFIAFLGITLAWFEQDELALTDEREWFRQNGFA